MSERNKYLTEAMGECLHEFEQDETTLAAIQYNPHGEDFKSYMMKCKRCGESYNPFAIPIYTYRPANFSTPEGVFKLWNWAIEQEWWDEFEDEIEYACLTTIINPDNLANAICEYLRGREK